MLILGRHRSVRDAEDLQAHRSGCSGGSPGLWGHGAEGGCLWGVSSTLEFKSCVTPCAKKAIHPRLGENSETSRNENCVIKIQASTGKWWIGHY